MGGSGGTGGGGPGYPDPISCTCGELKGTCYYRPEDFCFGLNCDNPGLLATTRGAAAFCDGDATQTMSYCEDGTYRFRRDWGGGENEALLVFSYETDELVYGSASGYLETPCGSEDIHAYAGATPEETSCVSCIICEYGEVLADNGDVLTGAAGAAGAAGAGGQPSRCVWSDEGVPLIP